MSETVSGIAKEYEVLQIHYGRLVSSLERVDLLKFSDELCKFGILSKPMREDFNSIDHERVDLNLRVRYLLNLVCDEISQTNGMFKVFLKALKKCTGLEGVCREIIQSSEKRNEKFIERCISIEDIPDLLKLMASEAHKWEEIGIILRIPLSVREDVRKSLGSSVIKLDRILNEWVCGGYLKPVNLTTFKTVLANPVVGLATLAEKISLEDSLPSSNTFGYNDSCHKEQKIQYQSIDSHVSYGKSVLLEVQVNDASSSVSYQWYKDGHKLPNYKYSPVHDIDGLEQSDSDGGHYFRGTKSSILLVRHRNMASKHIEGKYECWVDGKIRSNEISVEVHYPDRIRHLIGQYDRFEEVHKDSWPPRHTKAFVKLALINKYSCDVGTYDYSIRGDLDDILKEKDEIDYHDAFEHESGALVIVQGRPGCGKTTLAQKVTRDWSGGENILVGAELVFLISLRIMNLKCKDHTIFELLQNFYSDSNAKMVEKIIVGNQGDKTCFILDGLDEYHRKDSYVFKLLAGKLPEAMVIVFSRPLGCKTLSNASKSVEILGFNQHQIDKYVDSYFEERDVAQGLKKYLCDHINVLHMCYLPIHASMICYLYSLERNEIPTTETQIYEHFKLSTIMRKRRREDENFNISDLSEEDKTRLAKISKLAFDMTTASRQVLDSSETDIQLCDKPDSDLGLLTVDSTAKLYGDHHVYAFLHLTFQEYMAATYIFHLKHEEQLEVISKYRNSKAMMEVWQFYCGLMGLNIELHSNFLEQINLIFSSKCVNSLYRIQCAFESQTTKLYDAAINYSDQSLSFKNETFLPSDYNAIGHVISRASCPTLKLEFHFCKIDEDGIVRLGKVINEKMKAMTTLLFYSKESTIAQFQSLNILLSKLTALEVLDLYDTTLDKDAIIELTKGITLSKLKCLKIPFVKIFDGYIQILQLLKFNSSSFKEIYIGENYNTNEVQSYTSCLQSIFKSCNIVGKSSKEFAYFCNILLKQNLNFDFIAHCKILDMTNCGIEDSLMTRITKDLKKSFSLEKVALDYNRITGAGAVVLASSLQCLSTLKYLSVACNLIDDSGAKALASVLSQCTSLNHLNLEGNRIGDEGAVAITEAVKDMRVSVYLWNDKITEEGITIMLPLCNTCTFYSNIEYPNSADLSFVMGNAVFFSRAIKCCTSHPSIAFVDNSHGPSKADQLWSALTEELQHFTNLSKLSFHISSGNCLEMQTAIALAESLKSCINLQTLDISQNHFSAAISAAIIEGLKNCSNLQILRIGRNHLCLEGAAALAENLKSSTTSLLTLGISENFIDSKGAKVLATYLKSCTSLQTLDISVNQIQSEGAAALAEGLKTCTNLQALDISANNIDSEGAAALAEALTSYTNLEILEIGYNNIGLEGAAALGKHLKHCTRMLFLDISRNNIKLEGVLALREDLKCCNRLRVLSDNNN